MRDFLEPSNEILSDSNSRSRSLVRFEAALEGTRSRALVRFGFEFGFEAALAIEAELEPAHAFALALQIRATECTTATPSLSENLTS